MNTSIVSLFNSLFFAIAGICGIGFIIAFHELGHLLCAKMFNIRVQSFSIGFGPRLLTKQIGETEFALSAIPLGGYVDLSGPEENAADSRSFTTRPWYQKFCVMLGGIAFNLIFAYLALSLLFMSGMPQTPMLYPENATSTISMIEKDSAAQKAGLQVNDTILTINGTPVQDNLKSQLESIKNMPGQTVNLTVSRNGQPQEISAVIGEKKCMGKAIGSLGVGFQLIPLPSYSFIEGLKRGVALTNSILVNTFNAFKYLLTSCDTTNIAGPVMIFSATMKGAAQGFKIFLLFLAIISINLAILNLIPLPILDGGQILFYTIEAIIGRSIPDRIREYIFIGTWIGFMLLTVYLIGKDLTVIAGHYIDPILKFLHLK